MNCPSCGTDNPEGAHFCGSCGTPLPDVAAPAAPPTEPPAPIPPVPPATPPTVPLPPVPPAGPPTAPIPPIPPIPPAPPVAPIGPTDPTYVGGMPPVPPVPPDATTTFAQPPAAGPPPVSPTAKKSRKSLLLGLIALLVVAAAVGSFLVLGGDDGNGDAVEIVLEPIGQTITNDFAGNLDVGGFRSSIQNVLPDVPPIGSGIAAALSARRADGDTPGLFGGTRDAATCDVDQLVDFLTDSANEDKATAWAETIGIEVDEIEDFIRGLTPVRLRFDTRVTNHGFTDGEAVPFQSVLEAGTAVLVDDEGVPRAKCNCGNPLTEPQDIDDAGLSDDDALDADALVQNINDAWDDFEPELIVVIEAGDNVDEFVLVDIETGELFTRPVGSDGDDGNDGDVDPDAVCDILGDSPTCQAPDETTTTTAPDDETTTSTSIVLGTGEVQVTLRWGSNADLDLVVRDPNGEEASRSSTTSTGGQLDVDSNIGCSNDGSVENVFWPEGQAPAGEYTIIVQGFSVDSPECGPGDYEITVTTTGQAPQTFTGTVADGEESTHTFRVA